MFLKRNRRKSNGETYEYWSLVKTVRTARGPRHQVVANLGKEPGVDRGIARGWEDVADLLEGREPGAKQLELDSSEQRDVPRTPENKVERAAGRRSAQYVPKKRASSVQTHAKAYFQSAKATLRNRNRGRWA